MTVQPTTAESIGWQPLGDGAYLHVGDPEGDVITVVVKTKGHPLT
jgi:hypothetical protein